MRDRSPAFANSVEYVKEFSVVVWDAAHWINLAVSGVREKGSSATTLKLFFDRMNMFAHMFARGKGIAELKATAQFKEHGFKAISHFSTTR